MATRTAVCHVFRVLALGVLLFSLPFALEAQEQRTVMVGAAIVESANMLAIDAAKRVLADQPVSFFDLETTVVKDSSLFHLTVVFRPLEQDQSAADEPEITATIHFPRN